MLWITGVKDSIAKLCIYIGGKTKPNRKETIMTAVEQAVQEAVGIASLSEADKLRVDLESQQIITQGLRTTINNHRNQVRDLYTHLNDIIESDECDESAEISFGDLSILLNEIFGSELVFTKEYEVQVRYVLDATFKIRAASEDDARSIAEDIGLSTDPDFDIDSDTTEVDSCVVDQSRIDYVGKA